ncbi:MAG: YjbE family putative metal transport protein [Xanthobacteraceae bacterium]
MNLDSIGLASYQDLLALAQVVVIDVALAGDNALVIGIAAARVPPPRRAKVILWGLAGAVVTRVALSALVTQLLAIIGLTLAGGILLLWVCWKMYREFRHLGRGQSDAAGRIVETADADQASTGLRTAITQILVADLSMSLDNVLAVAGAANGNLLILLAGLGLSILLTAVAANLVAKWLSRYPWITWLGLAVVLYVALEMIWRGVAEILSHAVG